MSSDEKKGKVLRIVAEIVGGKTDLKKPSEKATQQPSTQLLPGSHSIGLGEGALDITMGFRQALKKAINASGKDKYQIIAEMGLLMSNGNLDYNGPEAWTSQDLGNGIPAEHLAALCHVTGSLDPLRCIAESLGCTLIDNREK